MEMLYSNDNMQSTLTDKMGESHQHYMAQKEICTKDTCDKNVYPNKPERAFQ